jgi:lysophospholipase L1-like esterase
MLRLQEHLGTYASPSFALPEAAAAAPEISWAGRLTGDGTVATSLPDGVIVAASSPLLGGPIRNRFAASLPGGPTIDGFACLAATRPYSCKGRARNAGSPTVLRIKTDAPVIELAGVVADGTSTAQTLIVDGRLVPPKVLSCGRGAGGWSSGAIRVDFGTRAMRDISIETAMHIAYLKVGRGDTLLAADDQSEPQLTSVGDSYQQARSSAFGNGGAIALEIGARLGLHKVSIDGIGGTGYWNSGGDLGSLNDRLAAHAADESLVYLVMAGINDYGDVVDNPPRLVWPARSTYEQAVAEYFRNLRAARPEALIVATAPFCPIPPMSDASYVAHLDTNSSGLGDFLYKAHVHKQAVQAIAAPWVYVDVLMGGGWLNSSGATGDVTNLQWFTGGTAWPGTTPTYKPGNTGGGGGGGYGGITHVPVVTGGSYTQAPEITASGGTGNGLLLASVIDASGMLTAIRVVSPGSGYTAGAGLPTISIDGRFETSPAAAGIPALGVGVNPDGQYPLPSFAPPGVPASALNNVYRLLSSDTIHPSPLGVEYLSRRLAQNVYDAVMAL